MWQMVVLQIGLVLLMRWLTGDEDSSSVETKIFNTTDKDEMVGLVAGKVVGDMLKDKEIDPATKEIIEGLVTANDKEALDKLIAEPKVKMSIADIFGNILSGILGIFGGKK
jgi:hypothetical protein